MVGALIVVVVVVVVFIRLINLKQIAFIMKNKEACAKLKARFHSFIQNYCQAQQGMKAS